MCKLAKEIKIQYCKKNKIRYKTQYLSVKFKVGNDIMHEEFNNPNSHKLTSPYSGPYKILKQLSDVNFEIDNPSLHFKRKSEIVHSCKLSYYIIILKILNLTTNNLTLIFFISAILSFHSGYWMRDH